MASSTGENGNDTLTGSIALIVGNEYESHHSQDEPRRGNHSRDSSVEYIRTIRKEMRRVLPRLPDLTLLRLLGQKNPSIHPWFGIR